MRIITDLASLNKAIDAAAKSHEKVDAAWQTIGVSAIAHFAKCGDTGPINRTYTKLGKGARHAAMAEFFLAFGGVSANLNDETAEEQPFVKDHDKQPDVESAAANPWFTMKKSPKVADQVDYLKLAMKLVGRKVKEGQTVAHSEVRERIAAIVAEYAADGSEEPAGAMADPLEGIAS
jgi:hypothetical protein